MSLPVIIVSPAVIVRDESGTIATIMEAPDAISLGYHLSAWFGGHCFPVDLLIEGRPVPDYWTMEFAML